MSEERFDVLDCNGVRTGRTIGRNEAHGTGAWHGAFHCLLFFRREGRLIVLFQKRSASKKIAPRRFDVSVGGHYAAGEDARSAGPREIREELGLAVPFDRLVPLGRRVFVYCYTPEIREYEIQDIFLLPFESEPPALTLQEDEVDGVLEMDLEEGISLFGRRTAKASAVLVSASGRGEPLQVSIEDFVPSVDGYYLKLLQLVRRYGNGERELLVI